MKALLLFMWKAVNDSRRTMRVITKEPRLHHSSMNAGSAPSGTLNLFGSGEFSHVFQQQWQKEGYPDYTIVSKREHVSGTSVSE